MGGNQAASELLGCSAAFVSYIKHGKRSPGRNLERVIEEKSKIPRRAWDDARSAA